MVDNIGQYTIRLLLHPMTMSCLKLPYHAGFSICVRVPVIRGLTRFLTMAEVAEVEEGEVIIDCVVIQFMKRAKEANIIARKISLDAGFRVQKNGL